MTITAVDTNSGGTVTSVGSGTGLTGGPITGSGSLSVVYGSSAGMAAQGNTTFTVAAGTGMSGGGSITIGAGGTVTLTNTDLGSSQNIFKNIANSAGTTQFSAASNADSVRFAGSGAASIAFTPATKTVTITAVDTNSGGTITGVTAGSGLSGGGSSGSVTLTNAGIISASAGTGISVAGTNPLTITNTGSVGVANSGGTNQFTLSSASDSVRFAGSGAASVSFTPATKTVTMTAVDTNSGGTVTNSGTSADYVPVFTSATNITNSIIAQKSAGIGIGTTGPATKLEVYGTGATGGTGWFHTNYAGLQDNLSLGQFTDSANTPSYKFQTDDQNGDILRIYSQRWGGEVRFDRSDQTGDRKMVTIGGSNLSPGYLQLHSGVAGDTVGTQIGGGSGVTTYFNAGNVGIGTASPGSKLDVAGDISVSAGSSYRFADNASEYLRAAWGIGIHGDATHPVYVPDAALVLGTTPSGGSYTPGAICFGSDCKTAWSQVGGSQWTTNGTSIYYNSGNVGIGSTNPATPLQVYGASYSETAKWQGIFGGSEAYNASPTAGVLFQNKYTSGGAIANMGGIAVGKENGTSGNYAGYLGLYTRANGQSIAERVRITSGGTVGIGTASPDTSYSLDVNGMMKTGGLFSGSGGLFTSNAAGGCIVFGTATPVCTAYFMSVDAGTNGANGALNITQTWNSAGTTYNALHLNVTDSASAASSGLLNLKVANNSKFFVKKDGSVGVGTDSLLGKLTVAGDTVSNNAVFAFGPRSFSPGSSAVVMEVPASTRASIQTFGSASALTLQESSGNVAVGKTSANYNLDVNGAVGIDTPSNYGARLNIGQTGTDYPGSTGWSSSWNANILLSGLNNTSISFHDSGQSVATLRYTNNNFYLGENVGWGVSNLTIGGNLNVNKVNASTIDPPYTISGTKYATYGLAMTGVKEETTGKLALSRQGAQWVGTIDFSKAREGGDFWLFSKTTDLRRHFDDMAVLLTPAFDGRVWYAADRESMTLTVFGAPSDGGALADYEVSYRLTAPRFDAAEWPNTRPADDVEGVNLDTLVR